MNHVLPTRPLENGRVERDYSRTLNQPSTLARRSQNVLQCIRGDHFAALLRQTLTAGDVVGSDQ